MHMLGLGGRFYNFCFPIMMCVCLKLLHFISFRSFIFNLWQGDVLHGKSQQQIMPASFVMYLKRKKEF